MQTARVSWLIVVLLTGAAWADDYKVAESLRKLPHVQSVEVKIADADPKTQIIHVCDWHMIGADEFAADVGADEKLYAKHLDDVEAVQKEQVELLTAILGKLDVSAVFQDGLTAEDMRVYKLIADVIARAEKAGDAPKLREAILRHGATGRLYRAGKIKEVLLLDAQPHDELSNLCAHFATLTLLVAG